MPIFNADLHIHSPYSIAVSRNINLDTLYKTAKMKGLNILGTGDITHPKWRKYLKENLTYKDGVYSYNDIHFIIQTELEDAESIHHVVLLPDFTAAERLQERLMPHVKNISGRWAGRPHVRLSAPELVDLIEDLGGVTGPAHAFTPFKSIFRQGRYSSLEECYGTAVKKLGFLELGLSADTGLADRMETLKDITFLSNSDAHSEHPSSLGREFNRFKMEAPGFDELKKALFRIKGRKVILNVGLDPRLGKYYIMFCDGCRRRVLHKVAGGKKSSRKKWQMFEPSERILKKITKSIKKKSDEEKTVKLDAYMGDSSGSNGAEGNSGDNPPRQPIRSKGSDSARIDSASGRFPSVFDAQIALGEKKFKYTVSYDDNFLYYTFPSEIEYEKFLYWVNGRAVECVACRDEKRVLDNGDNGMNDTGEIADESGENGATVKKRTSAIPTLRYGVSERINQIANYDTPRSPRHRPPYLDIIPLYDILRTIKGIKSKNSKSIDKLYNRAVSEIGTEYEILVDLDPDKFSDFMDGSLSAVIRAFRNHEISYVPGGGGTFGTFQFIE